MPNRARKLKSSCLILMIAKQLAVTINKNNTTAVSAASKAQINITKSKILLSKWMLEPTMKKRFNNVKSKH